MPETVLTQTPVHHIYYPDGDAAPDVPADMKRQAESVELAVSRISEAAFIVCGKSAAQSMGTSATEVRWDTEAWKQGIEHSTKTEPARFVIAEDGLYSINARLVFRNTATTAVGGVVINVNGVNVPHTWVDAEATGGRAPKPTSITDLRLMAGDVVRAMAVGAPSGTELIPSECYMSIRKSAGFASS